MAIPETLRAACLALTVGALLTACNGPRALGRTQTSSDWERVPRSAAPQLTPPPGTLVEECRARRVALAAELGGPSTVWLPSWPSDEHGQFFQQDDFYYLTGVEAADIGLLLDIDASGRLVRETLFLPPSSPEWERWNGPRLSPGEAAERSTGFASTAPFDTLAERFAALGAPTLHTLDGAPHEVSEEIAITLSQGEGRRQNPGPLRRALNALRLVKSDYEIQCLRNAIDITTTALRNAAVEVGDGIPEYALQGAIEGTYMRHGSERRGFTSICAAGPNAVTLHYSANRDTMHDGQLVLMDIGAKYRYYCADVTRTLPVNGRFSPRQREVYEIVLGAQKHAEQAAEPGMTIGDLHKLATAYLEERGYARYFTHGLGHWIGLDVHDVGRGAKIEIGTAFTIEPGVYIADEGLGIRIEDDYLMTDDGLIRLSTGFPREIDEIEALMAEFD